MRRIKLSSQAEIATAIAELNNRLSELDCDLSNVYCTLCTPDYYFGLIALHNSLLRSGTSRHLLVFIDSEWGEIENRNWDNATFVRIPRIVEPDFNPSRQEFSAVLSKLWIIGCTKIGKAVFLDSDTIVLQNIDDLFERPSLSFAPDFVEDVRSDRFNSGVFVVEPNAELFQRIIRDASKAENYDGGDQGILNDLISSEVEILPIEYNVTRHFYKYSGVDFQPDQVKVLHYIVKKPWELAYRETPDAILTTVDDIWTNFLDEDDLRALLKKWRHDVFVKYEKSKMDQMQLVPDFEAQRLVRSATRYGLRFAFVLLLAFITYPLILLAIIN